MQLWPLAHTPISYWTFDASPRQPGGFLFRCAGRTPEARAFGAQAVSDRPGQIRKPPVHKRQALFPFPLRTNSSESGNHSELSRIVALNTGSDTHAHTDPQVFWDPALTPSCYHGVTTVVAGNCGFSVAPTRPEHRELIARTELTPVEKALDLADDVLVEPAPADGLDDCQGGPPYVIGCAQVNWSGGLTRTRKPYQWAGRRSSDQPGGSS